MSVKKDGIFRIRFNKRDSKENELLNRYLMMGWGVIAAILVITYAAEVIKGNFTLGYYGLFLLVTVLPYLLCVICLHRKPQSFFLRYLIMGSYFIMYGFVLLTGHTNLVFTYVFPLLSIIILYHDSLIVLLMGGLSLLLNILSILRDYGLGRITLTNSRDYEIQIALILLCFTGCALASYIYDRLAAMNREQEQEVLRLQEEKIHLAERNKYAFTDAMTDFGNRRKYDEDIDAFKAGVPADLCFMMVDINDLKTANDMFGHAAGDELIVGVANCMRMAFEDSSAACYRLGGDEFAVIFHGDRADFEARAARLRRHIASWKGAHVKEASISIGYAGGDEAGTPDALFNLADERMYEDKKHHYEQSAFNRRLRRGFRRHTGPARSSPVE